jgi:hypothetical protein
VKIREKLENDKNREKSKNPQHQQQPHLRRGAALRAAYDGVVMLFVFSRF